MYKILYYSNIIIIYYEQRIVILCQIVFGCPHDTRFSDKRALLSVPNLYIAYNTTHNKRLNDLSTVN